MKEQEFGEVELSDDFEQLFDNAEEETDTPDESKETLDEPSQPEPENKVKVKEVMVAGHKVAVAMNEFGEIEYELPNDLSGAELEKWKNKANDYFGNVGAYKRLNQQLHEKERSLDEQIAQGVAKAMEKIADRITPNPSDPAPKSVNLIEKHFGVKNQRELDTLKDTDPDFYYAHVDAYEDAKLEAKVQAQTAGLKADTEATIRTQTLIAQCNAQGIPIAEINAIMKTKGITNMETAIEFWTAMNPHRIKGGGAGQHRVQKKAPTVLPHGEVVKKYQKPTNPDEQVTSWIVGGK